MAQCTREGRSEIYHMVGGKEAEAGEAEDDSHKTMEAAGSSLRMPGPEAAEAAEAAYKSGTAEGGRGKTGEAEHGCEAPAAEEARGS